MDINLISHPFHLILKESHLSPLKFFLFINSTKKIIPSCNVLAFADDLKMFQQIKNNSDCLLLKDELKILVNCFEFIDINFKVNKCWSMFFPGSRTVISHTNSIKSGCSSIR